MDPTIRPKYKKAPEIGRFLALSGGNVTFKLKRGLSNGLKSNANVKQKSHFVLWPARALKHHNSLKHIGVTLSNSLSGIVAFRFYPRTGKFSAYFVLGLLT